MKDSSKKLPFRVFQSRCHQIDIEDFHNSFSFRSKRSWVYYALGGKVSSKRAFSSDSTICSHPERQINRRRYLNGLFQGVNRDDAKDRAEDLGLVGRHVGVHVGDDRRSQEVPIGVLLNLHVATIELKCKLNGSLKRRVTLDQCLIVT